jgi:hypothetical protein
LFCRIKIVVAQELILKDNQLTKYFFMKHLIISLFLTGILFSAFAQTDSTSPNITVVRDSTPVANNSNSNMNSITNDSTGSINTSIRRDSTAIMKNGMERDSSGIMKNGIRSDSTGSINSNNTITPANLNNSSTNSNQMNSPNTSTNSQRSQVTANGGMSTTSSGTMINSQNIAGHVGYASLPVLETYVPADIVSKAKSKYNLVYDITAIKDTNNKTAYVVRYGDNGVYKTEKIGEDGNVVQ